MLFTLVPEKITSKNEEEGKMERIWKHYSLDSYLNEAEQENKLRELQENYYLYFHPFNQCKAQSLLWDTEFKVKHLRTKPSFSLALSLLVTTYVAQLVKNPPAMWET